MKTSLRKDGYAKGYNTRDLATSLPTASCTVLENIHPDDSVRPRFGISNALGRPYHENTTSYHLNIRHASVDYHVSLNAEDGWVFQPVINSDYVAVTMLGTFTSNPGKISHFAINDRVYILTTDPTSPMWIIEFDETLATFIMRKAWIESSLTLAITGRANADKKVNVGFTLVRRTDAAAFDGGLGGDAKLMRPEAETDYLFSPGILESVDDLRNRKIADGLWSEEKESQADIPFTCVQMIGDTGFAGDADGALWKTEDGGETWAVVSTPTSGYAITAMSFVDASTGYIADEYSKLWKTTNGGATFSNVPSGGGMTPRFSRIISSLYFSDAAHGVVGMGGNSDQVAYTTDGTTFTLVDIVDADANPISCAIKKIVSAGTDNILYAVGLANITDQGFFTKSLLLTSSDGGATWVERSFYANNALYDIFVDGQTAYAVGAGGYIVTIKMLPTGEFVSSSYIVSNTGKNLFAITKSGNNLVAFGEADGTMRNDGLGWEPHATIVDSTNRSTVVSASGSIFVTDASGSGSLIGLEFTHWAITATLTPTVDYEDIDPQATHIRLWRGVEAPNETEAKGLSMRWMADIPIRGENTTWNGTNFSLTDFKSDAVMSGITDISKTVGYSSIPPWGDTIAFMASRTWVGCSTYPDSISGQWYYTDLPQDVLAPVKWQSMFKTDVNFKNTNIDVNSSPIAVSPGEDLYFLMKNALWYLRGGDPDFQPARIPNAPVPLGPHTVGPDGTLYYLSVEGPVEVRQRIANKIFSFTAGEVWPVNAVGERGHFHSEAVAERSFMFYMRRTLFICDPDARVLIGNDADNGPFKVVPARNSMFPTFRVFPLNDEAYFCYQSVSLGRTYFWKFLDRDTYLDGDEAYTMRHVSKAYYANLYNPENLGLIYSLLTYVDYKDTDPMTIIVRGDGGRFIKKATYSGLDDNNSIMTQDPEDMSVDYRRAILTGFTEGGLSQVFTFEWSKKNVSPWSFNCTGFIAKVKLVRNFRQEYETPPGEDLPPDPPLIIDAGLEGDDRSAYGLYSAGREPRDTFVDEYVTLDASR